MIKSEKLKVLMVGSRSEVRFGERIYTQVTRHVLSHPMQNRFITPYGSEFDR